MNEILHFHDIVLISSKQVMKSLRSNGCAYALVSILIYDPNEQKIWKHMGSLIHFMQNEIKCEPTHVWLSCKI